MYDKFKIEAGGDQFMCSNCKKSSSEYYELLLQLKFIGFDNIDTLKEEVFSIVENNFNGVNKIEEKDKGFYFYFRSHGLMGKISNVFGKKYFIYEKRSKKIVGRDRLTTKDKCRYTLGIDIINLHKGDRVMIKGIEYYIKAINFNKVLILRDLKTGDKRQDTYAKIKDYFQLIEKNYKN